MSEELRDEVEAINAIYGDGSLAPSSETDDAGGVYVLALPGATSSRLRLQFPAGYPAAPPLVLGTQSSGDGGRRGAAARDLAVFRDAVAAVYQPGQVCLFDAVERFGELLGEGSEGEREAEEPPAAAATTAQVPPAATQDPLLSSLRAPPAWILSDPVTELRSTFVARCAAVSSPEEAPLFVQHLLASDKKVRAATHNITAWRIRGPSSSSSSSPSFQDCDDDGETAAGGRLLHLMQLIDLWGVVVVVTRWYGGHKLGPRRFALINTVARDAFVKAGLVSEAPGPKKKGAGAGKK